MDRDLYSPNFDAARPRSNLSSRAPNYCFATSSCIRRDADPIMSQLSPLHHITTTREVSCSLGSENAVPKPTRVCNSQQTNDVNQAAFSIITAAFASLGFDLDIRRRVAT